MKLFSLKNKQYQILRKFCEEIFYNFDINLIIIDSNLSDTFTPPINIKQVNSIIVIPYISKPIPFLNKLKIFDINLDDGDFKELSNNIIIDVTAYKIIKLKDFRSLIDFINIRTGKVEGSVLSFKISNGVLTVLTTIELFLLKKVKLETIYKQIFVYIKKIYEDEQDLKKKIKEINDKLKIEHLFNGNPLPILISKFEEN